MPSLPTRRSRVTRTTENDDATGVACLAIATAALATFLMDATVVMPLACIAAAAILAQVRTKLARVLWQMLIGAAVASPTISAIPIVGTMLRTRH